MSLGMIGQKAGMTRIFDSTGISVPVTAISVSPNQITQIKSMERDGYKAVQVSYGVRKESKTNKAILGHYKKASVAPGKGLMEFRLNEKEIEGLEVGKSIDLSLFKEGEHVDITGTTLGKGFQGGVKRHHFTMQDATHGNSISHRAIGSTGQCQDPGRVFKGKKMPGQLGNVQRTIQNLIIVKIMPEENIMLVKGSVPGHKGSVVIIKPTQKKYTPKEIYSESDSMGASPINNEGSPDEAQIVDETEKKENIKQDDKE